ncbi:MAG: DNA primase, partial [Desulfovibrio sp.]|nr:DNA primase [Desulfovibrio sp.]
MSAAQKIDFSAINDAALSKPFYLQSLLPHARVEGREFVAGDIQGSPGKSFKVNLDTGKWADFATGECGGDIISLVSAQGGIKQGEAARLIADNLALTRPAPPPLARKRKELLECPAVKENLKQHFSYRNADGSKLFCVFRYERHGYRKSIRQGVFRDGEIKFGIGDTKRVIYQLPEVLKSTLVIIVEGENKVVA